MTAARLTIATIADGPSLRPSPQRGEGAGGEAPEFIVGDAIAAGKLEVILKGWKQKDGAVHLVMPLGDPLPSRVELLADFLTQQLVPARQKRTARS